MRTWHILAALQIFLFQLFQDIAHADEHDDDSPIHLDLGIGGAYGQNGFLVPAPLQGGREDGKGGWFHLGAHPRKAEWFEVNCGGDFLNKDEGNWSWGVHCGTVFFWDISGWMHLGLGPFLGYHGERRLLTLSGDKLRKPEILHNFIFGLNPVVEMRLGWKRLWAVTELEAGLAPPTAHRYWEWETTIKIGAKIQF